MATSSLEVGGCPWLQLPAVFQLPLTAAFQAFVTTVEAVSVTSVLLIVGLTRKPPPGLVPVTVANVPVTDDAVSTGKVFPVDGTNPLMAKMLSVPSSVAAPLT